MINKVDFGAWKTTTQLALAVLDFNHRIYYVQVPLVLISKVTSLVGWTLLKQVRYAARSWYSGPVLLLLCVKLFVIGLR